MDEASQFQKILMMLGILMGFGLIIVIVYFIKKDNRSTTEKIIDRAKDLGSNIPGINN
jgi:hypothetical protein